MKPKISLVTLEAREENAMTQILEMTRTARARLRRGPHEASVTSAPAVRVMAHSVPSRFPLGAP